LQNCIETSTRGCCESITIKEGITYIPYDLSTQGCCDLFDITGYLGSDIYNLSNQRCYELTGTIISYIENKCGTGWYNPASSTKRCQNDVLETKCGDGWYNAAISTLRCQSNVIETRCGNDWHGLNADEACCGTSPTASTAKFYSISTQVCENNIVKEKCGTGWYDPINQTCENGNAVDKNYCSYSGFNVCVPKTTEVCKDIYGESTSNVVPNTTICAGQNRIVVTGYDDPKLDIFCAVGQPNPMGQPNQSGRCGCPVGGVPANAVNGQACTEYSIGMNGVLRTRAYCTNGYYSISTLGC
jgi:hypothetical protein